jgi:hypothetical protein
LLDREEMELLQKYVQQLFLLRKKAVNEREVPTAFNLEKMIAKLKLIA